SRLAAGELPLWNPFQFSGAPLLANDQSAALYPLSLLGALLPINLATLVQVGCKPILGALGTALLLRKIGCTRSAQWTGAAAFGLCGFMTVWLGWSHTNVALLL